MWMKKLICAVLILCMAFSLCACGGKKGDAKEGETAWNIGYNTWGAGWRCLWSRNIPLLSAMTTVLITT